MRLNAQSPEVVEMVAAFQENLDLARARSGPSGYRVIVVERRKYLAVDEIPTFEGRDCPGQSGRFLIDRETGEVYGIRGYGQRGNRVGTIASLTEQYLEGSASFHPSVGMHWETRGSRVASWPQPKVPERPHLTLVR